MKAVRGGGGGAGVDWDVDESFQSLTIARQPASIKKPATKHVSPEDFEGIPICPHAALPVVSMVTFFVCVAMSPWLRVRLRPSSFFRHGQLAS